MPPLAVAWFGKVVAYSGSRLVDAIGLDGQIAGYEPLDD